MSDEKKNEEEKEFTGILELAQTHTPSPTSDSSASPALEENPIEQIENWESLDEYAKSNPVAEPPPSSEDFPLTPVETVAEPTEMEKIEEEPLPLPDEDPFAVTETTAPPDSDLILSPDTQQETAFESSLDQGMEVPLSSTESTEEPPLSSTPPPPSPPQSAQATFKAIQATANQSIASQSAVKPAQPFSLLIRGRLTEYEQAKLLDVLHRENFGIREADLEPQLESGQLLIPQISEYACILLIQALRGTSADMRFGPSDRIFKSPSEEEKEETHESSLPPHFASQLQAESSANPHPAELIPLLFDDHLDSLPKPEILGTLVTTAGLTSTVVETQHSPEYIATLEALKKQLQYKAYRKGAHAVIQLQVHLQSLLLPSMYRLTVMGVAIRPLRTTDEQTHVNPSGYEHKDA